MCSSSSVPTIQGSGSRLPAAKQRSDEPLRTVCVREIAEETGLSVSAEQLDDWEISHRFAIYEHGVIAMRQALRIIRSMSLDFVYRNVLSHDLIRSNTSGINGSAGGPQRMRVFRGPTQQRFDGWSAWRLVAVLSLIFGVCS